MPETDEYVTLDFLQGIKVDGIISNNVLDHLQDPVKDLLLMRSLLKPGASMIHGSDGFRYQVPFTKWHLYFFQGKSVEFLANSIGMKFEWIKSNNPGLDVIRFFNER